MVFALVGHHVSSPQAKLQVYRTAPRGCKFMLVPQRPIFDINTKKNITWE